MNEFISTYWPYFTSTIVFLIDVWATCHVVLGKRDNRAALGWVGLIWFVPLVGSVLYLFFGINRIRRKARRLRGREKRFDAIAELIDEKHVRVYGMDALRQLIGAVTTRPISIGNRIQILKTGEAAYSEMISEIEKAQTSIGLSTYIFDNDHTGQQFVEALAAAVARGVDVRVLIDDIGVRYTFPSIIHRMHLAKVPVVRFMPSLLPWRFAYAQLRNHRKILVIDGRVGFTGGMNIREGHDLRMKPKHPINDCHFRIDGTVVHDLRSVFASDWKFSSGEQLTGPKWFPAIEPIGESLARGIASGPDDDFDTLRLTFLGALSCAKQSVRIVTPYFVPDGDLISALCVTALRGIVVDIFVPEQNNLLLVHWAMMGQIGEILQHGCRVWLTPLPFDHTKLLIVDDAWCLIGSANWDSRSLRLNFEFDVECSDAELVAELNEIVDLKLESSRRLTIDELNRRSLVSKLRDGVARLASPYL